MTFNNNVDISEFKYIVTEEHQSTMDHLPKGSNPQAVESFRVHNCRTTVAQLSHKCRTTVA